MINCTADLDLKNQEEALKWIRSESLKGTKSIGFIPDKGLAHAHVHRRIHWAQENDDPVVFCVHGPSRRRLIARVYQIWTRNDARRLLHAQAMIEVLERLYRKRGAIQMSCWCAADLESTVFWTALGFQEAGRRLGGGSRQHIRFVRPITTAGRLAGFQLETSEHGSTIHEPTLLRGLQAAGRGQRRRRSNGDRPLLN